MSRAVTSMKIWSVLCILFAFALSPASAADAGISEEYARQILEELRQIRSILEKQAMVHLQPPTETRRPLVAIEVGKAPLIGQKDAPFTIVEFTDFQCPFCNQFFEQTFGLVRKNYIDPGKVRLYSMDFPLKMHRNALRAAEAGRCAGDQGQFWAMHDRMQGNPARLEMTDLLAYAEELGINVPAFRQCIESDRYKDAIEQEEQDASAKGIRGTPAFVIGKSTPTGVQGELLMGTQPYRVVDEKLKALIDVPGH